MLVTYYYVFFRLNVLVFRFADKCKAEWWDKLFIHEQVIDTCKIDTTECADEIPAETQAALTKFHAEQIALERKME